jgi:hypothetical protein
MSQRNTAEILHLYLLATHFDPTWYKAWHTWALANFEVISFMETQTENKTTDIPGDELAAHIVQAVTGFFKSISLKNENALQDTLRLLTLWFKYGAHDEVSHAMATGFTSVEVDTWLEVIPQVRFCNVVSRRILNLAQPDHSTNSNAQHEHPQKHQQPFDGRRKAPPAGIDLSANGSL